MNLSTAKTLIWLSDKDRYPALRPENISFEISAMRELYQHRCLKGMEVGPRGHEVIRLLMEENQGITPSSTDQASAFLMICAQADFMNHLLNCHDSLGLYVASGDGRVNVRLDNKLHEDYQY